MPNFHSIVSRRDFVKALGLTGAGLGTAAAATPVFQDLDDVTASPSAEWKRPWWVKNREIDDPTTEIDWDMMYRSDGRMVGQVRSVQIKYLGEEEVNRRNAVGAKFTADGLKNDTPGLKVRDQALAAGVMSMLPVAMGMIPSISFMGPATATPEARGVAKYQGTPAENSRMLRSALIFYGAAQVGYGEVTQRYKDKLFRTFDKGNAATAYQGAWPPPLTQCKQYFFEDVPVGYDTAEKMVFPANVPLYEFTFIVPMSKEMFRCSPSSALQNAANLSRYTAMAQIQPKIQAFIKSLGYQCYGYTLPMNGAVPTIASAVLTGLGEGARNIGAFNNPEFGSITGLFHLITDLPLEPTPPIDAGMWRFCHTCTKCADACPWSAIPTDHEPSWDIPKLYGQEDTTHVPGKKQFWTNSVDCWLGRVQLGTCGACMGTCTFNTGKNAIHDYVKATLSTTPVFNSFLWQADKAFGYGLRAGEDLENWWDMPQPIGGFDSTCGIQGGSY
ncbi:reductive dehalogenase [Dehalococcoides mccartyi]|uniref:reductive dehalogenase n=1 Tax=Dehalococcoides mccartyi TaxID=61435 RepID=UPI00075045A5|nr:reductive dehalogenase [Dehalococcoides mccartyi]